MINSKNISQKMENLFAVASRLHHTDKDNIKLEISFDPPPSDWWVTLSVTYRPDQDKDSERTVMHREKHTEFEPALNALVEKLRTKLNDRYRADGHILSVLQSLDDSKEP